MAIPTSATWDVADFNSATMNLFLGSAGLSPGASPYFTYGASTALLTVASADGTTAYADLSVAMPGEYTVDFILRLPQLPHDAADVLDHHFGIQLADDAGRGVVIYFSHAGVAIARLDDFGSVASLPDSTEFTQEISRYFHRVRVAVNSVLGRAYVFIGKETDPFPPLRVIIPVENTPAGTGDRFRLVARGTAMQPVQVELRTLQLASALLIPNMPPTANAGQDRVVSAGNTARLDGRASFDPEGAALSYTWQALDAPYQSSFAYDASDGSTTDDGDADGVTHLLTFPPSTLPSWVSSGDVLLMQGTRHTVDTVDNPGGTLLVTTDTLPDDFSGLPFRIIRQSLLVDATTETPVAVPDIPGLYRFGLTVNDGEVDSEVAEVLVSVVAARAPLGIEPAVEPLWEALGDEWRLVTNRDIFTEFWRGTTQILGARLLEVWQHHYNMNLRDSQRVFQRKWVAFRSVIAETSPTTATIKPRYGKLEGTYDFSLGNPAVAGSTLVIEVPEVDGTFTQYPVTLSANDIATIQADITAGVMGLDIIPGAVTDGTQQFLSITSNTLGFRLGIASSAAAVLGLETAKYNYLGGTRGAKVTDNTYRVDTGVDLLEQGVQQGDLLVLNGGQAFRIDRVLNDARDPGLNQRLLLRDALPFDTSVEWEIPSTLTSTEVNYETQGTYPGDLVKVEVYDPRTNTFVDCNGYVVAQYAGVVSADLDGLYPFLRDPTYELRWLGVKRRKGTAIPADVISIPRLQDVIPVSASPTTWSENIDYVLEPFYRGDLEQAIPQLQFRDSVFIDTDLEPPDIFWAEVVIFSNDQNIEDLFGRLTGFLREDAAVLGEGLSYLSGVSGLMYAMQRGPSVYAMRVGAQILFGQPFAEVAGYITEIRNDYSPEHGRILIQDDDGNTPSTSEIIRSYVYRKDPLDEAASLEVSPATGQVYAVGDYIKQFAPIAAGVRIEDYKNTPGWFIPFVSSGLITELEKFFYFTVNFNLDLVSLANLSLIFQYIYRVKPTYTHPILLGSKHLVDDIDPLDVLEGTIPLTLYDTVDGFGRAFMYDDYRGDGTLWTHFDGVSGVAGPADPDGLAYFDGLVDCPADYAEVAIVFLSTGDGIDAGLVAYLALYYPPGTTVVPVSFTGGTWVTTGPAILPPAVAAGYYAIIVVVDAGNQVLP